MYRRAVKQRPTPKPIDVARATAVIASDKWLRRLRQEGECIVTTSSRDYPRLMIGRVSYSAHRVVCAVALGRDLDPAMDVDHICNNTRCVNPDHLQEITHGDNVRRAAFFAERMSRTHCPQGHEHTPDNQYPSSKTRNCKTCIKQRARDRYWRLRDAHLIEIAK